MREDELDVLVAAGVVQVIDTRALPDDFEGRVAPRCLRVLWETPSVISRVDRKGRPAIRLSSLLRKVVIPRQTDAFLSDREVVSLVAPDGAVEWLCLPRPDSPSRGVPSSRAKNDSSIGSSSRVSNRTEIWLCFP